jgi:methylmalonyl-CoA mutase C-terminal domain/subunit
LADSDPVLNDTQRDAALANGVRVLVAKTSLDGHWRGVTVVGRALRDAGFEVVLLGMVTAAEITRAAIDEDVDLVGLNIGGRVQVAERIVESLRSGGYEGPVIAGGTIPPYAARRLNAVGVECFPPGSPLADIVAAARRLVGLA